MRSPHDATRVVALVPAAGLGVRLGESMPKAFVPIGGSPMLAHAVDGLIASGVVDRIVIMVPAELVGEAQTLLAARARAAGPGSPALRSSTVPVSVVTGGIERTDSVRAGLAAAPEATHYLVHDAARALTPPPMIARVVDELRAGQRAVVPGVPVTDTIKSIDEHGDVTGTPDRARLRAIQTPQGFDAELLHAAYAHDVPVTDDAGLVELLGASVRVIPGDPLAFKITTPLDLRLARTLLAGSETREAVVS
ncbi:2-C-methyl-D-erythritol 4-phosphate cytidylyltransferase [Nocardia transvalensis]|uniref:2-C-methyl-D-erythritol 4-phosphate cytidylyltransferase n=2 Tax=Nocardia transvalensis TaxID=37333 RepID=UPI000A03C6C7|nr:2-C-methyl-D-erythritol 4-phosphate cytidylyltransferase [Nocardia transvalensis]